MNFEHISRIIHQQRSFVLTTHVNPDGDGLGSELALAYFLRKMGKDAVIVNHSPTPDNYRWLDTEHTIIHFNAERDQDILRRAQVIFILDTNQPDRLRSLESFVIKSSAIKIVIDHHLEPHPFAQHYLIDENATSTGEIVYNLLKSIDLHSFDLTIAKALYTAIMTDTGSFRFPRTDAETHTMIADLLRQGVDPVEAYVNVYENWSQGRMRLLGEALHSMKITSKGKLAYITCTQKMFTETGTTVEETDNFTSYPMSIRGVVAGILFTELEDGVKISFRSKGAIPINELAKEFGGNGHLNAAGTRLYNVPLDETISSVVERASKYLKN